MFLYKNVFEKMILKVFKYGRPCETVVNMLTRVMTSLIVFIFNIFRVLLSFNLKMVAEIVTEIYRLIAFGCSKQKKIAFTYLLRVCLVRIKEVYHRVCSLKPTNIQFVIEMLHKLHQI